MMNKRPWEQLLVVVLLSFVGFVVAVRCCPFDAYPAICGLQRKKQSRVIPAGESNVNQ
jgi:hypothetical protein